jgi:hypothetical protein
LQQDDDVSSDVTLIRTKDYGLKVLHDAESIDFKIADRAEGCEYRA